MSPPTSPPTDVDTIARLRAICLSQEGATERDSHGSPSWFASSKKQFASLDDHHHGAAHLSVWLAQPDGRQADLLAMNSALFFRPPYVGHRGWVGVVLDRDPPWDLVEQLVADACRTVMIKKPRAPRPQR